MKLERSFALVLSRGAGKALDKLETRTAKKIIGALQEIQRDPLRPRPGVDILKIRGRKEPPAYRLKLGRVRIEYLINEKRITAAQERALHRGRNRRSG